ncbi:MAG: alpha/beta fold hydrolase [Pseudomonadales bacterium]|jgi:pimeloyl-ACP methyl ester carboxylesterase
MAFATINGARLWYDVQGEGEPLLLHHGFTASRVNWQPVADRLKGYQIIMMECRGTGDSEHTPDGYSIEQYAADVIGLLDHLKLDKVSFAGHSMGGGIGYTLGLRYPQRLNKLILMAPIPAAGIQNPPDPEMVEQRLAARNRGDRDYFMREQLAQKFRDDVQTNDWFNSRVDHLLGVSEGHLLGGLESMLALNVEQELGNLTTPTLMLAGAVDGLLPANLYDFSLLPNATLHVLSRAGHEVAVHEPDETTKAIADFMQHGPLTAATLAARQAENA